MSPRELEECADRDRGRHEIFTRVTTISGRWLLSF